MRKNISSLLQRGNLKPKERMLLLVYDAVKKETTGKEILTEADRYALSGGWIPANYKEFEEYNRYNDGWRLTGFAELDAQTIFLNAKINFLRAKNIVDMVFWHDLTELANQAKNSLEDFRLLKIFDLLFNIQKKTLPRIIDEKEALELVLKNSGLGLDEVIYAYTFESLSKGLKKDILALYPEAKTESQYLDQEEILANLFNGKDKLTKEAKEKLANFILTCIYLPIEKLEEDKRLSFVSFFAELPTLDILKKWADYNEILTEREVKKLKKKGEEAIEEELTQKLKDYAKRNKKNIRDLLRETILRWLDEGLFVKEYQPMFNKEVFKKWLEAKAKATETIKGLINKGELKVVEREWEMRLEGVEICKKRLKIITGESLYNLKGDFAFVKDFKKQADVFRYLGCLILFLRKCRFIKDYAILLAFKELFKKLSKVYEIDLTYKINGWINDFKEEVELLNQQLIIIADQLDKAVHSKHNITFLQKTFIKDMLIDLDKVKPSSDVGLLAVAWTDRYHQEFRELFKEEF